VYKYHAHAHTITSTKPILYQVAAINIIAALSNPPTDTIYTARVRVMCVLGSCLGILSAHMLLKETYVMYPQVIQWVDSLGAGGTLLVSWV
jgi:hypothetical protein